LFDIQTTCRQRVEASRVRSISLRGNRIASSIARVNSPSSIWFPFRSSLFFEIFFLFARSVSRIHRRLVGRRLIDGCLSFIHSMDSTELLTGHVRGQAIEIHPALI